MLDKTIGSLSILLNAKDQGLTSTIDGVRAGLISFTKDLAGLLGVGLSVAGVVAGLKEALNFGGNMYDLSKQTGAAVNELVVLRQALDETGVGAGRAMFIINMMQRNLANLGKTKGGREVIKELGLNMKEIAKMSPMEKLKTLGSALSNIPEKDRMHTLTKLFGRGGIQLRGFFANPNALKDVEQALGRFPALVAKNAKSFHAIEDVLSRWKYIRLGLFTGIMEGIAPAMKAVADAVAKIDFSGIGQSIGRGLLFFVNMIKQGKIWEWLKLQFIFSFSTIKDHWTKLWDFMKATLMVLGDFLAISIAKAIRNISPKLADILGIADLTSLNQLGKESEAMFKKIAEVWEKSGGFVVPMSLDTLAAKEKLDDFMLGEGIKVSDMILAQQDEAGAGEAGAGGANVGMEGLPGFIRKYAPAAIQGTAEGYRAEMGLSKSMDKVADNTAQTAENTSGLKPSIDLLNQNLDFAMQGES